LELEGGGRCLDSRADGPTPAFSSGQLTLTLSADLAVDHLGKEDQTPHRRLPPFSHEIGGSEGEGHLWALWDYLKASSSGPLSPPLPFSMEWWSGSFGGSRLLWGPWGFVTDTLLQTDLVITARGG